MLQRHFCRKTPALLLAATGCATPAALPSDPPDASHLFEASLPDALVPDGFILTVLAEDGGTTAIEPGSPCAGTGPGAEGATALDASAAGDSALPVTHGDAAASDATPSGTSDASAAGDSAASAPPHGAACPSPLAHGDLVFDEAMISSVAGSSDRGQWLEVRNTRPCSVNLSGLHASAPHGAAAHSLDVTSDLWLPGGGFFLIADSTDPTENNALPGLVLAWTGSPADALHKTSDTITLSMGSVTLDTLSYSDKKRTEGTSMAFPANCAPSLRSDFTSWQPSNASWAPGFFGTPGAPNTDVMCAVAAVPMPKCAPARRPRPPR